MAYPLDYSGQYEMPISSLTPLPEEMRHCCFSDQLALTYGIEVGAHVCVHVAMCMHEQLILSFSFSLSLLSSPSLLLFHFSLLYTSPILPLLGKAEFD